MFSAKADEIIKTLKKEYPGAKYYLNFSNPVELMVATILSAQCRDSLVNSVTENCSKNTRQQQTTPSSKRKT